MVDSLKKKKKRQVKRKAASWTFHRNKSLKASKIPGPF